MDLVFNALPDVFTYQSLRHASYDAPWLNDTNANKGRRAPVQQQQQQRRPSNGGNRVGGRAGRDSCDNCPLCQEKQRRPLATYIRSKSRQDRREDASIQEEDEEAEAQEEEAGASPASTGPALGGAARA
ncbi:uncharacterized protein GBIM_07461 [Gryllus bimaculatus]|nr:uncharacterized protein GBIM_07461 [Gryllus bimaculatus]